MNQRRKFKRSAIALVAVAVTALATACSSSGSPTPTGSGAGSTAGAGGQSSASGATPSGSGGSSESGPSAAAKLGTKPLVIMASDIFTSQRNFNPFSPDATVGTKGFIYEPLFMTSMMQPGKEMPWLAKSSKWSDDGKTLTITLRDDVKWSDGQPFTSKDVAYTFQAMLDHPALNTTGITFTAVTAPSPDTVALTWKDAGFAQLPKVGNIIPVPEHIFSSQNPQTFTNPNPVATGPFTLESYSLQSVKLKRNPTYWQASKITVPEIQFPIVHANALETMISQSKVDWSDAFVPDVESLFVKKDAAHNKYWYPADGFVYLGLNLKAKDLGNLTVRQAISTALDRAVLGKTGEYGYEFPVSPTGLVLPAYKSYLAQQYANLTFTPDAAKANAALDSAGFKKGPDGIRVDPTTHQKMDYSLMVPTGFIDWVAVTKLIKAQLLAIGIQIDLVGGSSQQWTSDNVNGNFEMTMNVASGGPTPYQMFEPILRSTYTAAVGKPASSNFVRWSDPATDKLFDQYDNSDDPAVQKKAIEGIETIMVNQLPVIPLLGSADWYQYRTANYVGWPSESDPYAMGMPSRFPDNLLVLNHLTPAS